MGKLAKKVFLIDFRKYDTPVYCEIDFIIEKVLNSTILKAGEYINEADINRLLAKDWVTEIRAAKDSDFKNF